MANEDDNPTTPLVTKPNSNPSKDQSPALSGSCSSLPPSNCNGNNNCKITDANGIVNSPLQRNPQSPEDFILSVASKIASQPLQYSDPDVWGVLTAISDKARKRLQVSILLQYLHNALCFFLLGAFSSFRDSYLSMNVENF